MEKKLYTVAAAAALVVAILAVISDSELVAAAAPEGPDRCQMTPTGLMACLPSITSAAKPPTRQCCTALRKADLSCLCAYKDSPVLPELGIDPELALQLPHKCKLTEANPCE